MSNTNEEFCYSLGYLKKHTLHILFWSIIFDSACVFFVFHITCYSPYGLKPHIFLHIHDDTRCSSSEIPNLSQFHLFFSLHYTLIQGLEQHSHVERLIRATLRCSSTCYRPAPPPPPLWDNPLAEWTSRSGQRQPTGWEEPLSSNRVL